MKGICGGIFPSLKEINDLIIGVSITVDSAMSSTSTNPVQNKVVKAAIDDISYSAVPEGTILPYAGYSSTPPNRFLFCEGAAINRITYATLFSRIGTEFGAGDGSTTFNLPDLRNKFPEGSETVGEVKTAGLPNIIGNLYRVDGCGGNVSPMSGDGCFTNVTKVEATQRGFSSDDRVTDFNLEFDANSGSVASGIYKNNCYTVQPPALTVRYIIRY